MKFFILSLFCLFNFVSPLFAQKEDIKRLKTSSFEKEISLSIKLNYLIYLPEKYISIEDSFPLVLFLHGAGERGSDVNQVKRHGIPKIIESGAYKTTGLFGTEEEAPFILVAPQCPENIRWDVYALNALINYIEENYRIDADRIYVTGLSMGGHGTWSLATTYPNRFAAIAPVCGWIDFFEIYKLKNTPIWAFHGAKDNVVPVKYSEDPINVLRHLGSENVKLSIYPEANHDAWTETYNNPEFYKWLLSQKRK